ILKRFSILWIGDSKEIKNCAGVAQPVQLKFLHKSGIDLRPGGTPEISRWRNHWIQSKSPAGAPEGRETKAGLSPLRGGEYISTGIGVIQFNRKRWERAFRVPALAGMARSPNSAG